MLSLDYNVMNRGPVWDWQFRIHTETARGRSSRRINFMLKRNLRKLEFYGDLGLDGDRLIAKVVRFVFPLLNRVDGGL